jgi:branched-chain amino acid transport system ATP-binding protein
VSDIVLRGGEPPATDGGTGTDGSMGAEDEPVIECRNLDVGYGRLTVARGISFSVVPRSVLTILGPNGAGKTTLLMTLAGFLPPRAGTIVLDGQPVRRSSPRRMNKAGLVLVPDFRALFTELTPIQNLKLACHRGTDLGPVLDLFPALERRKNLPVGQLSGGEQQMLAIARALVQSPRLLLIDEMSMGLAPVAVESLMPVIRRVADEHGAAVIMVEQHVQLALEVADAAIVMVHGSIELSAPAAQLRHDTAAVEGAYMSHRSRPESGLGAR